MKTKKIMAVLLLIAAFAFCSNNVFSQSCIKHIIKAYKANLDPYTYTSYASNKILFDSVKTQTIEVEFSVFAKEQYKLVICSSGFQEEVKVDIYDKSKNCKTRKKIYDSENGIDNLFWSFVPPKTGTYFIEYLIPPAADKKIKEGYMVMLIGNMYDDVNMPLASLRK